MSVTELKPLELQPRFCSDPLIFLAGPIQGAPNWQHQAVSIIRDQVETAAEIYVANPRRDLFIKTNFNKAAQIDWEKFHLYRAHRTGGLVFWLARRDFSLEYEEGRCYAQTTRQEFGRAMGWRDYNPSISMVLGIEPGYVDNEDYYRHSAREIGLHVHGDLESTVIDALDQMDSRR